MAEIHSPLRYPGGKAKLYHTIKPIVEKTIGRGTYIEPFAGGSGLALALLMNNDVSRIVINDIDYCIYCFWYSCIYLTDELCEKIEECTVDIATWIFQKDIYMNPYEATVLEVGFATFFLNRCNVSGVIQGGPIGGQEQTGTYKIDARFNKRNLITRIRKIELYRNRIEIYNFDANLFMQLILPQYPKESTLINIDPPYVKKGPLLYENAFVEVDHWNLAKNIGELSYKWIVTYDECQLIYDIYKEYPKEVITLRYSAGQTKKGSELLVYSNSVYNQLIEDVKALG